MKLLRAEYEVVRGKPVICLFTRDETGKRIVVKDDTFVPYFYVKDGDEVKVPQYYVDKKLFQAYDGNTVRKIYTRLPEDVAMVRDKFSKTYEADILFPIRYTLDKIPDIEPTKAKIIYLDIETLNDGKFPDPGIADQSVVCITMYDNLDDTYTTLVYRPNMAIGTVDDIYDNRLHQVKYFGTEHELLKAFVDYIGQSEADVITGWNVEIFDLRYLINRMRWFNIDPSPMSPMRVAYVRGEREIVIKGVAVVDLLDSYRKLTFSQEESYRLGYIANKVTGEGKNFEGGDVNRLWNNDVNNLIAYNTNDVRLVKNIDEKLELINFLDEIRRLSGCHLEHTFHTSKISDCYILRLMHNRTVFPTKIKHDKTEFEGAFVGRWGLGIYDNVAGFDLKSLYPSITLAANLSPETVKNNPSKDTSDPSFIYIDDIKVRKDIKGFLPEVYDSLFGERDKYKRLMAKEEVESPKWKFYYARQYAVKIILNAIYGQTAFVGSRIHDPRIAKTITYMGRQIISWSKTFMENKGFKVLYCDTDSVFVQLKEGTKAEAEQVLAELNASYKDFCAQYNIDDYKRFKMEFERIYSKIFFGKSKKRYAGAVKYQDGQDVDLLRVMGFEIKRSDSSQFSKKIQENVFEMLLRKDKSKGEVLEYIGSEIERIRNGKYSFTEIGIPKGINKDPSEYVSSSPHLRGIEFAKKMGYQLSNKPKMIYVLSLPPGCPETDAVCFDEDQQVPPGTQIDVEQMLEKTVKQKLLGIFEALGWDMSDLVHFWKGKASKIEQLQLF